MSHRPCMFGPAAGSLGSRLQTICRATRRVSAPSRRCNEDRTGRMQPSWLIWARELQAIAQTGLTFAQNPYDRERYEAVRALAARILAEHSEAEHSWIE